MADFNYVTWTDGAPVSSEYLTKMSENDQNLKDLLEAMPQGILGWAESATETLATTKGVFVVLDGMTLDVDIPADRLIRVSYHHKGIKPSGVNTSSVSIHMDGTQLCLSLNAEHKEWNGGPWTISHVHSPPAGTHRYTVRGKKWNGDPGNPTKYRATAVAPRQLIVEDLGAYIDPSGT